MSYYTTQKSTDIPSVSERVEYYRKKLRKESRPYGGLRYIAFDGEHHQFTPRMRAVKDALANIDKQNTPDAFRVFTNPNHEVVIKEERRLSFFHLV